MCITVFDRVLEGWNLDTKDLTVNTGKSQSRGIQSLMCSFGGENPEEKGNGKKKKDFSRETFFKRKEEKRNGHFWAVVTHHQKYPPPPESSCKGKRNHIAWIEHHLETPSTDYSPKNPSMRGLAPSPPAPRPWHQSNKSLALVSGHVPGWNRTQANQKTGPQHSPWPEL